MPRSHGLRVLLAGATGHFEEALRAAGHEVDAGPDAPFALGVARAECLDVAIIDLQGVGGDPFALVGGIRAASIGRKPMFIALARGDVLPDEARCREAGIDLLLMKPVEPRLLAGFLSRLREVVDDYDSFDPMI